ncbi:MFS transporter [Arthrobacter tecti]
MSAKPPKLFWVWLGGLAWTSIGTSILSFGLVWTAVGRSAFLGGIVLTMVIIPRVLLLLLGGSVADRVGAWRVMVLSDSVLFLVMAGVAVFAAAGHSPSWLLITAALAMGIADAFYLPAAGSVPKFLVPDEALQRAMGGRQIVGQLAAFVGPVAGGFLVSLAGLAISFTAGAVGFLGMLFVLMLLRRHLPTAPNAGCRPRMGEHLAAGLRVIWQRPTLVAVVGLTTAFAAFIVPLTPLLLPLLGRTEGWTASQTGLLGGAYGVTLAIVAGWVMLRGGSAQPGHTAAKGISLAGLGVVLASLLPHPGAAAVGLALAGLGTGIFSTHVGPVFVSATPHEYMARVQSVLITAQSVPLLLANPAIGLLAAELGARPVILLWGLGSLTAGAVALTLPVFRSMRRHEPVCP